MKKILLGAAAITLLITGCAQNELLDGGIATPNDGKIYFAATSGSAKTRAAIGNPINSSADLQKVGEFHVEGYVNGTGAAYVNADPKFNGVSWEYADEPYWPNAPIDFYAYANWDTAPGITSAGITASVTIGDDVLAAGGHKDLLVAGTFDATKEVRTLLTFKHALTQIVFKAGNINPSKIDVQIGAVEIVNVANSGNMAFTKAVPNAVWTNQPPQTAQRTTYVVQGIEDAANVFPAITTPFVVSDLSATPNDYNKFPRIQKSVETDNNALMLIPQDFTAWDVNSGVKADVATQHGAYIKLTTLITRKGLLPGDADAAKYIYAGKINAGNTAFEYGTIYIPVESAATQAGQWVAGKRINYIITFGDSNSGSGGGGYDENGDPILVPIRFRAVVEDWVETNVPLLTATFEATSSSITHKFIDGYTNQLLNDIKAAPAPKVYKAEIKLKGTNSSNIGVTTGGVDYATTNIAANVTFQTLLGGAATFQNAKFRPGSTLKYDMTEVSNLGTYPAKVVVPTGWRGQATYNGNPINAVTDPAGKEYVLDGTNVTDKGNGVLLTKIATTGYSYVCQAGYIEDNLAAVELNENHTATFTQFNNTITVSNPMPATPAAYFFSSDMLAKIENAAFNGSTLTINMTAVTIAGGRSIQTVVPKGWTIAKTEDLITTTYYPGDLVAFTTPAVGVAKTLVYTKQLGTPGATGEWKNEVELEYWLGQAKTALNRDFYYDNVDGLIVTNLAAAPWTTMIGEAGRINTIYFKNNIGQVKTTAASDWEWDNVKKALTYTVGANNAAFEITYLTKSAALAKATGTTSYITAAAPATFDASWIPSTNVDALTLFFSDASGVNRSSNGWTYTAADQKAVFAKPTPSNNVTELNAELLNKPANTILYTAVLDFTGVIAPALATAEQIYVVVTGAATNLPAGWAQTGNVVTYTKP